MRFGLYNRFMTAPRIALLTKWPTPGLAKTRLIPALGAEGAARLHARLVQRTLTAARASDLAFEVRGTGGSPDDFAGWLGDDVRLVDQGEGDLGERLARVPAPMLLIGGDAPDLTPAHLCSAAAALNTAPAVLGPAADGGYWLLGLSRPMPHLFASMPWGTDRDAAETIARLGRDGIVPITLPTLHDCDRPEDLSRWPNLAR